MGASKSAIVHCVCGYSVVNSDLSGSVFKFEVLDS